MKSREIDIIGILKATVAERRLLAWFVGVVAVLGVVVALSVQKRYTATVVLAPEISGAGGLADNLSDLASMVGVNISSSGSAIDAIYPEIYPDVLQSSDFILQLFAVPVLLLEDSDNGKVTPNSNAKPNGASSNSNVKPNSASSNSNAKQNGSANGSATTAVKSYYDHIKTDTWTPFWAYPGKWLGKLLAKKGKPSGGSLDPFYLTREEDKICRKVRSNIACLVDKKTSVITISLTDTDPLVAATMTDTVQRRLQDYIIMYRTRKLRNDLQYAEQLFREAKEQYLEAQQDYARYSDANNDIVLQAARIRQDALENEMQLKYNNYNQVATQLQLARAKLQENTPSFSVIQAPTVPLQPSGLPRSVIVLLFLVLGFAADATWITYLRPTLRKRKAS